MKKHILILVLIIFLITMIGFKEEQNNNYYNVLMYKNNEQRTGFYDTKGVPVLHGIKWKYNNRGLGFIKDGILYAGMGELIDCNTGKMIKKNPFSIEIIYLNIAIGRQIVPSQESFLSCYDLDTCHKLWENKNLESVGDCFVHKDILYVYSQIEGGEDYGKIIYLVNPMTGEIIEQIDEMGLLPYEFITGMAFWKDTMVLVATGGIITIDFSKGKKGEMKKIFSCNEIGLSTTPVISNDNVYFGDTGGNLFSVKLKTGKINWKIKCHHDAFDGPNTSVSIYDGIVYVSNIDSLLFIDEKSGKIILSIDKREDHVISPVSITKDGIYFSTSNGMLYALDRKTGKELWSLRLAKNCVVSPILSNGVIYIPAYDTLEKGWIFAIY